MKPKLSKAAIQLREQIDDDYPSRDRRSDGSFADARHLANNPTSDHILVDGFCRAIEQVKSGRWNPAEQIEYVNKTYSWEAIKNKWMELHEIL